jgi:hypothetical protein
MWSTRAWAIYALIACSSCSAQREVPARTNGAAKSTKAASAKGAGSPEDLVRQLRLEVESFRKLRFVGMDDGPVPDFELKAANGAELDSQSLVGREAFVIVFFATWCDLCERKLTSMQRAMAQVGPMRTIPVSVDGPETWPAVSDYLQSVGIYEPAVRAADYPSFALAYNPFATVPLLVIVGRNGGLVDYQLGLESEHEGRLVSSLRLAKTIGPLAKPRAFR